MVVMIANLRYSASFDGLARNIGGIRPIFQLNLDNDP
jgi:hypothetical protein